MRSIIYAALMAATAMPMAAHADPSPRAKLSEQRTEVRDSRREVRQGQAEVRRDIRRGDWQEAREDKRELRQDRRDLREDRRDLREARRDYRDDRRDDRRDAWRDYRARNRHVYHRPSYVGPSGYRYQAWRPGWRLPASYYGRRYVIADPWHYRLHRPAAGYLRWVRYGDDVLLVDVRNGMIREVIRDFFW